MRVCLVSPELHPLGGGGLGVCTAGTARALADAGAEVCVLAGGTAGDALAALRTGEPPADPRIALLAAPAPQDWIRAGFTCAEHAAAGAVLERFEAAYRDRPPDLVEVADRLGLGAVLLQARTAGHRALRGTRIVTRLAGTSELRALQDAEPPPRFEIENLWTLERLVLGDADRLLWAGGDTLARYERHYGAGQLAPAVRVAALPAELEVRPAVPRAAGGPLRILFAARMRRSKGAVELAEALLSIPGDGWRATFAGADAPSGSLGASAAATLEQMFAGDPRVALRGHVERDALPELFATHDVLVAPSAGTIVVEALRAGLPVVAAGAGALVQAGISGWAAAGTGARPLAAVLRELVADPAAVDALRASGAPLAHGRELADPAQIAAGYERLIEEIAAPRPPRAARAAAAPLVSAVVPVGLGADPGFLGEALASLAAQDHPRMELIVVADGPQPALAPIARRHGARLLTTAAGGSSAARNAGIGQATGRYVLFHDADDVAERDWASSAVALLEERPEIGWVSCWLHLMDAGGQPPADGRQGFRGLSRELAEGNTINVLAGASVVVRATILGDPACRYDERLAMGEDWAFARRLLRAGHRGATIPRELVRYRDWPANKTNTHAATLTDRIVGEVRAFARLDAAR